MVLIINIPMFRCFYCTWVWVDKNKTLHLANIGYVGWLDGNGCSGRLPSYPTFTKRPYFILTEAGAYPQLPTQPKIMFGFKLIQRSNMVILSCLAKKNQNLNLRKKSSVYYWKLHFQGRNAHKPPFSVINWTFFPQIQILIFLREATQNDHIRLLYKFETEHFFLVVLGVVDMRQLLLKAT